MCFGCDYQLKVGMFYEVFCDQVLVWDYEVLKFYVECIKQGEKDVFWLGLFKYFVKIFGMIFGVKYILLIKDSMFNYFGFVCNVLFNYYVCIGNGCFLDGKMIFLFGSLELEEVGGIFIGWFFGIVNYEVFGWLCINQLLGYKINCIEEWEEKLEWIIDEIMQVDMCFISGILLWVQMYYECLLECMGKCIVKEVFFNYFMFVYGGVNFEFYCVVLENLVGECIDSVEIYLVFEGFIVFQDL